VLSKSGHAFIKQVMREVDAIYGGEMSAHHYFATSPIATALIPWLLVTQIMSDTGKTLSEPGGDAPGRALPGERRDQS
jgi:phosphomannomutase